MINIYIITNLLNNKSYIGQTKHTIKNRIDRHKVNNTPIGKEILKYGDSNFKVDILYKATTEEEANEKEIEYIKSYNTIIPNGYNTFEGGIHNKRAVINLNTMVVYESISEASRKTNTHTRGIVQVCNGELKSSNNYRWMYYSDYLKVKDTLGTITEPDGGLVKVINLDTNTIYPSISKASRKTGISKGSIGSCCRGITNAAGRQRWMYYDDYLKVKDILVLETYNRKGTSDRRVVCVETGKAYPNMIKASEDTGASRNGINAVCRGREKSAGGYRWMYEEDYLKLSEEDRFNLKSIVLNDKIINVTNGKIYSDLVEASKDTNTCKTSISKVCRGVRKTANGFVWRYYSDYLKLNNDEIAKLKTIKVTKRGTAKKVLNLTNGVIYNSVREASIKTGVSFSNIGQCCRGKTRTAGGYKWFYIEDDNIFSYEKNTKIKK